MKLCYVDETGTDGKSPVIVMVGIVADSQRLSRTQAEFASMFASLDEVALRNLRELKAVDLHRGKGAWYGVPGATRQAIVTNLCSWLCDRKHQISLAAIDLEQFRAKPLDSSLDAWMTAALHIALQIQRSHQSMKKNKGATFLVFDEHVKHDSELPELLFNPPPWTDGYYGLKRGKQRLDQVIDTAFYARSHHVGLVQIADLFAFLFRRYSELMDYGEAEAFTGERDRVTEWVKLISRRLLPKSSRWPARSKDGTANWYSELAPSSLISLG